VAAVRTAVAATSTKVLRTVREPTARPRRSHPRHVVQTIASTIVAWFTSFPARDYPAAAETARQAPVVDVDVPPLAASG
jgi:hypothetical protein